MQTTKLLGRLNPTKRTIFSHGVLWYLQYMGEIGTVTLIIYGLVLHRRMKKLRNK